MISDIYPIMVENITMYNITRDVMQLDPTWIPGIPRDGSRTGLYIYIYVTMFFFFDKKQGNLSKTIINHPQIYQRWVAFEISIWLVALLTSPNYQSCSNSIEVNDFPQHGGERIILRVMQTRHKKTSLESVVLGARILRFLWVGKSHQSILGWFMTLLNSNIHSFC